MKCCAHFSLTIHAACSVYLILLDSISRDVTGYILDDRDSILGRDKDFPLHHHVQTDSGTNTASYSMTFMLWQSGRNMILTAHSHRVPSLRMRGALPILPIFAFMA
jgi:hypothetical protein